MAVRRINTAISRLNWGEMEQTLLREPVEVCDASLDDWNLFVDSEDKEIPSNNMKWENGKVWIVEFPCAGRGEIIFRFMVAMIFATGTKHTYLNCSGTAHTGTPPPGLEHVGLMQPDCSFGPQIGVPGAVVPPEFTKWNQYHTVKVEIGISRDWNALEDKAAIWKQYPGVNIVVSIKLSRELRLREYRLEQCVNGLFPDDAPIRAIDQDIFLQFGAHALLGLPENVGLSPGFHDPVRVDLFHIVDEARARAVEIPQARPADQNHGRNVRPRRV